MPNGKCCDPKFTDRDSCIDNYAAEIHDSYYLNNGNMCPKQITDSSCFKRSSNMVTEALLYKGIPKKQDCIQSGCIPKNRNDNYCCSKQSIINLRCPKGYKNKSCIPNSKYKKEDGMCLKENETRHNCKSGKDIRDGNCKSEPDNHPWKCGKKNTPIVSSVNLDIDDESINHNINENTKSGLWKFFDMERNSDNLVYYGHEVLLTNVSNIISYLCVCDDTIDTIDTCGNKVDVYCYNDIQDAKKYGKWIIIPKFFNKFNYNGNIKTNDVLRDINREYVDFDFYEDYSADYYDFDTLKSKKIPIEINDKFLIVNANKIDGHYVYLNFCSDDDRNLEQICNENIYKKVIGSIPKTTQLANFNKTDLYIYNWSIVPTIYDINVYDTLFIDGSIKLGEEDPIEITTDTLRYIKSIPYHFDKEICIKDENNMVNCINKEHIEMLNGSRPINIQSTIPAKPFILYSGANYTGRELRIGFDYENTHDLPYIGDINEWLNPNDHGKWMSLKIEGPYSAIIFNKPNYGYDKSNLYIEQNKMTLYEAKDKKYPPIHTLSTTLSEKQALCYLENNPGLIDSFKPKSELGSGEDDRIEKAKDHWINYGLWEIGTDKEKKSPFMCDYDNNNTLSNNTLNNNIIQNVVKSPGITNIRDLGKTWNDGIRSIIFRYKNKDGEYKEISSTTKSFELKCLEKKRFLNQPYKQNNNRGNKWRTDESGEKVKNQDSGTLVDSVIYTANLCKNGNNDQSFYLTNDNDSKFVDSKIYDIESDHIHFHRHSYDINHEQLEDINDI